MMAAHYGIGVLPARPRKPRDKAKVEAGVRLAQTYILGRLRNQTFFSLDEANRAILPALDVERQGHASDRGQPSSSARNDREAGARRCRRKIMNMPIGVWFGSISTITLNMMVTSTQFLMH
jgi:hypothetical protein